MIYYMVTRKGSKEPIDKGVLHRRPGCTYVPFYCDELSAEARIAEFQREDRDDLEVREVEMTFKETGSSSFNLYCQDCCLSFTVKGATRSSNKMYCPQCEQSYCVVEKADD